VTVRGKHVLITGGSSGIGLALAQRCVASGARVSLVARVEAKLAAARAAILAATPEATVGVASADVAVESEVLRAISLAEGAQGPVDVLVTSAGTSRPGKFEELPVEVFKQSMAVNYFGTLYPVKALVPAMRRRGSGAVILISSGAGLTGLFGYSAYAPSKFALRGLAESLRAELKGTGVQISIVYPPDTDTPQLAEENLTKPVETKALTAGAGLWTADAVARATLEGFERGSFAITPGLPLTALFWFQSLIAPLLSAHFDRVAARARENNPAGKPGS
jgi:3-dehydrosphinganine reductase